MNLSLHFATLTYIYLNIIYSFNCIAVCNQKSDLLGVVGDCNKYMKCVNGKLVETKCAPDKLFDYTRKVCDSPEKVKCLIKITTLLTTKTSSTKPMAFMNRSLLNTYSSMESSTTESVWKLNLTENCTKENNFMAIPGDCCNY